MSNNQVFESLNDLKLTSEERKLISKLNKKIPNLEEKSFVYFDKDDALKLDTKEAFIVTYKNSTSLNEYKKIILEFEKAIDILNFNAKEELKFEDKKFPNLTKKENLLLIKNTLNNYNQFYIKNLKIEALNILTKFNMEENKEKKLEFENQYREILSQIRKRLTNKNILNLNSIRNDYSYLSKLIENTNPKYKLSLFWKSIIIVFALILILLLLVGILVL